MKKLFVDEQVNVSSGVEAEYKLNYKNDLKYIENDSIHKVDKDRWFEAQKYERKTWMVLCGGANDDRNYSHFESFDNYKNLTELSRGIKSVIELGCGPFTNLRTLFHLLPDLEEVHLVDPLLEDYLNHPNCFYKNRNFFGYKTQTHSCPIEELSLNQKFDLLIMNNVLEHCFDITLIFSKIYDLLNENGIFIFHDVYYNREDIFQACENYYDAGHPIKLSGIYMEENLSKYEVLFERNSIGESDFQFKKYFIGKKK